MDARLRIALERIRREARTAVLFILVVTALTAGISLLFPAWYRAESTILPPQESADSFGLLANMIETSALSKVGLITTTSTSDLYVEMLKSRRVREALVQRFDLTRRYHEKNLDECLKKLDEHVDAEAEKSRIVRVSVEDKDPKVAAEMTNALVNELENVNRLVRVQRATSSRSYLEDQLAGVESRLHLAEGRLTAYEKAHGIVIVPSESQAVEGAADLLARKMSLQVRQSWLQSFADPNTPSLTAVGAELSAVDRELSRLPGIKQEGARLSLDVEIQRRVYTLLTAQLEEARLAQDRGVSPIAVLDAARPPTKKARPKRVLIALVALGASTLLAGLWVGSRVRSDYRVAEAAALVP